MIALKQVNKLSSYKEHESCLASHRRKTSWPFQLSAGWSNVNYISCEIRCSLIMRPTKLKDMMSHDFCSESSWILLKIGLPGGTTPTQRCHVPVSLPSFCDIVLQNFILSQLSLRCIIWLTFQQRKKTMTDKILFTSINDIANHRAILIFKSALIRSSFIYLKITRDVLSFSRSV